LQNELIKTKQIKLLDAQYSLSGRTDELIG